MPGLVALVALGDEVHVEVIGSPSFADDTPLAQSAIFRIASLTKPVTAVAAMALVEEGVLRLDQPVDDLLPELADRRVLRAIDGDLDDTVPAIRPITLEDLLSFRMGFGSVMAPPGTYPIQRAEAELGLQSIGGPPWPPVAYDVDGWIAALGTLPLMYQPGEQWALQLVGPGARRALGPGDRHRCRNGHARTHLRTARHARHWLHRAGTSIEPADDRLHARSGDR
jgi:CubicO group peptidase (beta-lactamase class C family)